MNQDIDHHLAVLVAPPDPDDVDAALRRVLRRSRRQARTQVAFGAAAATAVAAAGITALVDRGGEPGDGADVATGVPADDTSTVPAPSAGGWPWTTSTTAAPAPMTPAERAALVDEVLDATSGRDLFRMCCGDTDPAGGPVPLELRADAVALAAEYRARWGDAVDIRLGCRRYPTGEPVDVPDAPRTVPTPGPGIDGLTATLTVDDGGEVPSGADTTATLTLHNSSAAAIEVLPPNAAEVAAPGGDEAVGTTRMIFALVAEQVTVPAGGEVELDVVVGTTACSTPDGPPGLVPGTYEAVAEITTGIDGTTDPTQAPPTLVTRAPFTVTPLTVG